MADLINYPDVLGAVTRGSRLTLDVASLAFGTSTPTINAGSPFDALLVVQNEAECAIDVQIKLIVPAKDVKGFTGRFTTKADKRIAVGLHPAEVGYVRLPVIAYAQAAPGNYTLQIEVEIKRQERKPNRIRDERGGSPLRSESLSPDVQTQIKQLGAVTFSAATTGRFTRTGATLTAPLTINAPTAALQGGLAEASPLSWQSLWTLHDSLNNEALAERARPLTGAVLPQLERQNVFFPLLRATQTRAERAGYRLWAGEATMIAKLLTLTLESGLPAATAEGEAQGYPEWFMTLCRVLIQQPELTKVAATLATEQLYADLMYDATMSAFTLVRSATAEDLGNPDEMAQYARDLARSFAGAGEPLNYVRVYLPLILGGLLSNRRMMLTREERLDSLELIVRARQQRISERTEANAFVFELTNHLLDRMLTTYDTSLQRYLDPIERLRHQK